MYEKPQIEPAKKLAIQFVYILRTAAETSNVV